MNFKEIKKLHQKKYRIQKGLFIVEGIKSVAAFLSSDFELKLLLATDNKHLKTKKDPQKIISEKAFAKISGLQKPEGVLAVFKIPCYHLSDQQKGVLLVLDGVKDPGNLGTIIRTCHWFGVEHILCSKETVDAYNPKVVQASMGSLGFVKVHYTDIECFLKGAHLPIFGTDIKGDSIYKKTIEKGVIVMGNESHGISKGVRKLCKNFIGIPAKNNHCESLNVAVATGIILSNIKLYDFI